MREIWAKPILEVFLDCGFSMESARHCQPLYWLGNTVGIRNFLRTRGGI